MATCIDLGIESMIFPVGQEFEEMSNSLQPQNRLYWGLVLGIIGVAVLVLIWFTQVWLRPAPDIEANHQEYLKVSRSLSIGMSKEDVSLLVAGATVKYIGKSSTFEHHTYLFGSDDFDRAGILILSFKQVESSVVELTQIATFEAPQAKIASQGCTRTEM